MAHVRELPRPIRRLYPRFIRDCYEICEWRHGGLILSQTSPVEWSELMAELSNLRVRRSDIVLGNLGGRPTGRRFIGQMTAIGWRPATFATEVRIVPNELPVLPPYQAPTIAVALHKGRVAVEVECDDGGSYPRALHTFRTLFDREAIDVSVVITRSDDLMESHRDLSRWDSFWRSEAKMTKMHPLIRAGAAGGCPVVAIGVTRALVVRDEVAARPEEVALADLLERISAIRRAEERDGTTL